MGIYCDRYQSGEHEAVWADLLALGKRVHEEPVYSDALAVARETMSRARTNIETLIVRLDNIGYQFETARDSPPEFLEKIIEMLGRGNPVFEQLRSGFDKTLAPASTLDERSVYSRAGEWSGNCISELEGYLQGPLPLSLRAWYECIQHVSFLGSHPILNPGAEAITPLPDPFTLMSLPDAVDYESWESKEGYPIAVDEFFKANLSREHRYYINFRDARADTIFADWQKDTFVAYLRRVFKWGGFPGWARHPNPPSELIGELTDGLVAI